MPAFRSLFVLETFIVLTTVFLVFLPCSTVATSQSEAFSALGDAEDAVVSAYRAVSKAEAAGANVSDLLIRLNDAGDALSRAHMEYGMGDYDAARELADSCQNKTTGFVSEADALTDAAIRNNSLSFMVNIVGPIVGSVGVACLGVVAWIYLNRRYGKTGG